MSCIKLKIDGNDFSVYYSSSSCNIIVQRNGLDFAISEEVIILGKFKPLVHNRIVSELNSNLDLYRRALNKAKNLKAFL